MFESHGNWHKGEIDGWRPLPLVIMIDWQLIGSGLENVETCYTRPGATSTSFRVSRQSHEATIDGLEEGGLRGGAVLVCTDSGYWIPIHTIYAGVDFMFTNVAIALPVLAWDVCDLVHSRLCLRHINSNIMWESVAGCTERGVPEAVDITVEDVGCRITGLIAVSKRDPVVRRGDRSGHERYCGSSFWNSPKWHPIKGCNTIGIDIAIVNK